MMAELVWLTGGVEFEVVFLEVGVAEVALFCGLLAGWVMRGVFVAARVWSPLYLRQRPRRSLYWPF
jgi:hypothetical protein